MGQHVHPPNLAVQQNQDHVVDEIPNLNSERVLEYRGPCREQPKRRQGANREMESQARRQGTEVVFEGSGFGAGDDREGDGAAHPTT